MAAKILAGIAVTVLVGVVVGAVVFLAAPAAVAVAGFTITAAQIGIIAGGMTAATGVAATVQTALNDDGAKRIGEYLHNSFQASAEMGGCTDIYGAGVLCGEAAADNGKSF